MKIVSVADRESTTWLSLAGVKETRIVENPAEAEKALTEFFQAQDIGLIIITERLANEIRPLIRKLTENPTPVLIEIPDRHGPFTKETDPVQELLKKAVGIDIKMKPRSSE